MRPAAAAAHLETMTDQTAVAPTRPVPSAEETRDALRDALIDGFAAVEEFTGHRPTLKHLAAVIGSEPDVAALRAEIREVCSFLLVEARTASAEAVAALKATLDATRQPLRCPDCGGTISVVTGHNGSGYLAYEEVTGFECDDFRCQTEWDKYGDVARGE